MTVNVVATPVIPAPEAAYAPLRTQFADGAHALLNRAFADLDAQFEQFAADPLCAPDAVLSRQALHQVAGQGWSARCFLRLWLVSPESTEQLSSG